MKLPFGKYQNDLIHISEVQSGRTDLTCPNCGQSLIAKKGKLKEHHFAHDGASCSFTFSKELFGLGSRTSTKLPLCIYAKRKKESIEKKLRELQVAHSKRTNKKALIEELQVRLQRLQSYFQKANQTKKATLTNQIADQVQQFIQQKIAPFPAFHLLRDPVFKTGYTNGKNQLIHQALNEEQHEYYYPLVFQPYVHCLQAYHKTSNSANTTNQIELYQKELSRFQQFQLYFIEIQIPSATIHKIGLTSRPISIRLKEIQLDLLTYFKSVKCKVLVLQQGVAFLEQFFKRKYATYQFSIGTLTEYFQFPPTLLNWIVKDLEGIGLNQVPNRSNPIWIYWAYFHSNGKLYGGKSKHLFVEGEKYRLTSEETKKIKTYLLTFKKTV